VVDNERRIVAALIGLEKDLTMLGAVLLGIGPTSARGVAGLVATERDRRLSQLDRRDGCNVLRQREQLAPHGRVGEVARGSSRVHGGGGDGRIESEIKSASAHGLGHQRSREVARYRLREIDRSSASGAWARRRGGKWKVKAVGVRSRSQRSRYSSKKPRTVRQ